MGLSISRVTASVVLGSKLGTFSKNRRNEPRIWSSDKDRNLSRLLPIAPKKAPLTAIESLFMPCVDSIVLSSSEAYRSCIPNRISESRCESSQKVQSLGLSTSKRLGSAARLKSAMGLELAVVPPGISTGFVALDGSVTKALTVKTIATIMQPSIAADASDAAHRLVDWPICSAEADQESLIRVEVP